MSVVRMSGLNGPEWTTNGPCCPLLLVGVIRQIRISRRNGPRMSENYCMYFTGLSVLSVLSDLRSDDQNVSTVVVIQTGDVRSPLSRTRNRSRSTFWPFHLVLHQFQYTLNQTVRLNSFGSGLGPEHGGLYSIILAPALAVLAPRPFRAFVPTAAL